eukprot:SAG11_NODE_7443_length_1143_cov_1.438697_2_plen_79_part_00
MIAVADEQDCCREETNAVRACRDTRQPLAILYPSHALYFAMGDSVRGYNVITEWLLQGDTIQLPKGMASTPPRKVHFF